MSSSWIQVAYLAAAVLFIVGLKALSSARTARFGNGIASLGMLVAIVATLLMQRVISYEMILVGILIGAIIGGTFALRIQMTAMPQMVALLNGFGGAASALIASSEFFLNRQRSESPEELVVIAIVISVLIGGLTFTGSLIAFGKLQELLDSRPFTYPGQQIGNGLLFIGTLGVAVGAVMHPDSQVLMLALAGLALVLGILVVIPIGGGDMPVVISLLNSYSGLAACATGFVLGNGGLVISGSLVGASGIILTKLMCEAMNRSLWNVLFSAFGKHQTRQVGKGEERTAKSYTPEDAAIIFANSQSCVIVPGYGLAVAQAQHAAHELGELLESQGIEVRYAIHPVAGRMPGHMNVLLAEAKVAYEQLVDMDDINPEFPETDVVLVVGANDVVNPAAREDEESPIYGMPILDADYARNVFVIKRSMNPGFAGIDNPLFYRDNTMMIFGDAKGTLLKLIDSLRQG